MKLNRLLAVALGSAMLMGAATAASAAESLIQGVVFFGAGTPVTNLTKPGSQVSFSFEVPSSFSGSSTTAITDFDYMLNGVTVADPVKAIDFFGASQKGMFDIVFVDHTVSIYGADIGSGGVITGLGFYGVTAALNDGGATGTGGVTVSSAAPEPASWLLMMAGVGGLGLALRRARRIDNVQAAVAA